MKTRMEKYYDEENNNVALREKKNMSLYENIDEYEVEDYKIEANATVLDNNAKNIDVEKIKKILDTKYNRQPKRRSIVLEEEEYQEPDISLDETREYDINAILEKARNEKEVDYEKERLKAAEALARRFGLFKDNIDITSNGKTVIVDDIDD